MASTKHETMDFGGLDIVCRSVKTGATAPGKQGTNDVSDSITVSGDIKSTGGALVLGETILVEEDLVALLALLET